MASPRWSPGTLIAGRFEIEALAKQGGMSQVFHARDRQTGEAVALKLLEPEATTQDGERFLRESQVLAGLHHPGIVRYVAHGKTAEGDTYLAMEWLEGEDLAQRLVRAPLTVADSLTLVRRTAEILAVLHESGMVHRDVKPSNLFLRGGAIAHVTLLDFGIARGGLASWQVTQSGIVVGTLHYLAPEQARGDGKLWPGTDVYSLGCVLFECLIGRPPFDGDHVGVVLARILREEPPLVRRLRPELPEALETLLLRMLAKQPEERLGDGTAVLAALEALELPAEVYTLVPAIAGTPALTGAEQRLVSLVLASPQQVVQQATMSLPIESVRPDVSQTIEIEQLLSPYGAQIDRLANGALLVTLSHAGQSAVDQAMQAARCARLVHERMPEATVALTTGRTLLTGKLPVGEAVERAVHLLQAAGAAPEAPHAAAVWLDDLTARLVDGRFDIERVESGVCLLGAERSSLDDARPLLGRPTPCVGREQELSLLESILVTCIEEPRAGVVLVTAPPGVGKSRLRHELYRRLTARGVELELFLGRGDPLQVDGTYTLLRQALRTLARIEDSAPLDEQRARLAERLGRHLPPARHERVLEFLGELVGVPFLDEHSAPLRAARQNPRLMSDQIAEAFIELVRAECAVQPVLLVLEDLHWGDAATVRLVDRALRDLEDQPLFVLALGRPEVRDQFSRLWEERHVQELRLPGLGRKSSERLVREMLGATADPGTVARIVEQAGGNALFLEELIRAVAEGRSGELPETMLAMLQARLLHLAPEARRLLRAASLQGEVFWRGGVVALLGADGLSEELEWNLANLVKAEIIVEHRESRFVGEAQYGFRHALLRDAAYSLLAEEDRQAGHRLVGAYLEQMGERDPLVLAEHLRRGRALEEAAVLYTQAAAQALKNNDFEGALKRVERGLGCSATGETLGTLRSIQAWAHLWTGNVEEAFARGLDGSALLPPGRAPWYVAVGAVLYAAGLLGRHDTLREKIRLLEETQPEPEAEYAFIENAVSAFVNLMMAGRRAESVLLLERMEAICERLGDNEARVRGQVGLCRCYARLYLDGEPVVSWAAAHEVAAAFAQSGDRRFAGAMQGHIGFCYALLGDYPAALTWLRAAIEEMARLKETLLLVVLEAHLAFALVASGDRAQLGEARAAIESVSAARGAVAWWRGVARLTLARLHALEGDLGAAEETAREALALLVAVPVKRPACFATLGRILLERGKPAEARLVAEEGLGELDVLGGTAWMDVGLRLVAAEARHATGDQDGARAALGHACHQIRQRAQAVVDLALRERYLTRVAEHARALALEAEWGVQGDAAA